MGPAVVRGRCVRGGACPGPGSRDARPMDRADARPVPGVRYAAARCGESARVRLRAGRSAEEGLRDGIETYVQSPVVNLPQPLLRKEGSRRARVSVRQKGIDRQAPWVRRTRFPLPLRRGEG